MCGRAVTLSPEDFAKLSVDLDAADRMGEHRQRFNLAPTQHAPVIRADPDGSREAVAMKWGLVPRWAKDPGIGSRAINARSETSGSKPMFRDAWAKRRAIVPVAGFYEWRATDTGKVPHYITREAGSPMLLAGLWERWAPSEGEAVETFTILTTAANDTVGALHDRMPVMIERADLPAWLDAGTESDRLRTLCEPRAWPGVTMWPVPQRVNSPRNEGPELIERDGSASADVLFG